MSIKLNAQSGGSVALDAPTQTDSSADITFKLPVADGNAGQALKTDGSNQLGFADFGKLLKVVRAQTQTRLNVGSNTGTFFTSSLTADITPSAASSKIFILASGNYYTTNTTTGGLSLFRGNTNLGHSTHGLAYVGGAGSGYGAFTIHYLDTAADTNAHTYNIACIDWGGQGTTQITCNRGESDADQSYESRTISTVTLTEIAA